MNYEVESRRDGVGSGDTEGPKAGSWEVGSKVRDGDTPSPARGTRALPAPGKALRFGYWLSVMGYLEVELTAEGAEVGRKKG